MTKDRKLDERYDRAIRTLTDAMRYKLYVHRDKGFLEDGQGLQYDRDDLLNRLEDEVQELRDAIEDENRIEVILECADVANFAMLLVLLTHEEASSLEDRPTGGPVSVDPGKTKVGDQSPGSIFPRTIVEKTSPIGSIRDVLRPMESIFELDEEKLTEAEDMSNEEIPNERYSDPKSRFMGKRVHVATMNMFPFAGYKGKVTDVRKDGSTWVATVRFDRDSQGSQVDVRAVVPVSRLIENE